MAIDPAECRTWAQQARAAWEVTPLLEQRKGERIQVGFELSLFHGADLLVPVRDGDRERLKPLEDRLHELGLKARSW
jgi:hypothetical protein